MELIELKNSDKENSIKYLLKNNDEELGCGYIFNKELNPIEIYIEEKHQSNGYGKFFFNSLLKIFKDNGVKGMIFEVDRNNFKFMNIIQKAGGREVGRELLTIKYVIKL